MESNKNLLLFLKNSFLANYLEEDVTDITYNGIDLFVEKVSFGKKKVSSQINNSEVGDFLSHLANLSGKNFNTLNPILDISFLNYRLNAIHPLIAKKANEGVYTFALRVFAPFTKISKYNIDFCSLECHEFLEKLIKKRKSILISGKTGVGKTEFQKYLVGYMEENVKVIIIEDLYETYIKEIYPNLDITSWVSFDNQKNIEEEYQKLIKAALRNNPDWLMIAEVRGKEAKELYQAFSTGHPFIATIHAKSAKLSLKRFALMMGEDSKNIEVLSDLAEYINFSIHLEKRIDNGRIVRFISSIVENYIDKNNLICKEIYNYKTGLNIDKVSTRTKKELEIKKEKINEKE